MPIKKRLDVGKYGAKRQKIGHIEPIRPICPILFNTIFSQSLLVHPDPEPFY